MSRTFIGIKIQPSKELLEALDKYQHVLREESIKWVDSSNFHLTLHFLGQTSEEQVQAISASLSVIAKDIVPFELKLKGIGVFPNPWRPRIFFAGANPVDALLSLYESVEKMVESNGFERENRPYHAHLTFARIKYLRHTDKLQSLLKRDANRFFQEVPVSEIILFESISKPSGVVYEPLAKFKLG